VHVGAGGLVRQERRVDRGESVHVSLCHGNKTGCSSCINRVTPGGAPSHLRSTLASA
jgi:hypothetical protein